MKKIEIPEEIAAEIVSRYQLGESHKTLATYFPYSESRIWRLLKESGLTRKCGEAQLKVNAELQQKMAEEYNSGLSTIRIAEKYNVSYSTVNEAVRSAGEEIRSISDAIRAFHGLPPIAQIKGEYIREMYEGVKSGFPSIADLAHILNCSKQTIRNYLIEAGARIRNSAEQRKLTKRVIEDARKRGYRDTLSYRIMLLEQQIEEMEKK